MASDPPPQRPDEELVVVDDADFGPMRLIRRWSAGRSEGEREWREFDMLSWEAKRDDVAISIDVAAPSATPGLAPNTRSMILRVISNEAETRVAVAENIIDIAREWMFMSGDGPEPTIDSFAAGIVLETIGVDRAQHVTVWLEEIEKDPDLSIFHGHGLCARLDGAGNIEVVDLV